ncbi:MULTISPECIES: protein-L-isoaspartate(D-aspartate) O-methyltransferase [unclassified Herbaspirillum]|uniref:protein-L-isoaspartate(D-aspartate) O-methyltransferase n=1 Tax=unclassified Herbaspirillum TaxID=2624150 RepID=UPI000E2EDB46|nr:MULTISPECIES: protein-L-isoaspartate(D-aspartate) O-methyltransferase [unclassified Herbaspirillum]RFB68828.1 protein-L-isoaspartate(D-aspartate) O-methyltransferase [Herbaspirillum sp. 3R-3a1]TFI05734.1 protein-L-isoaspartate(D-aspartate) O-methyltransferase [Herbaspirillum sp. 3R11]TFI13355.1 protein-L-isoaspartate(D-aspartate) O-methyltransferase [Herbaspirillum sp. 3R-11]TFI20779.1 protein-L-isoaspartate(D-aspartate) O-methyltransferase [Herbaspirillum sp. 3C11]
MTGKPSRFPLSLSSVVEKKGKTASGAPARTVVTPQTATRNAALDSGRLAAKAQAARAAQQPTPASQAGKTVAMPVSRTALPTPIATSNRSAPLVSEAVRKAMVARVAKQGVSDQKVLAAMEAVPRHMFMEPGLSSQAYIDASLPIGHHQTISQPYIVARMIEIMRDNNKGKVLDRVLEIGTGCGYQAAVLSLVAKEVFSIERIKPLHELAKTNLRPLRIANIRLHYGDGMLGLPQVAPFDGIILAAAGLEVPQALLEQLAIGGRLVAPVGGRQQMLQLIERISKFEWTSETLEECHFVPLRPGTV